MNTGDAVGAGKFRGGLGYVKDYRVTDGGITGLSAVIARSKDRPWPGAGGKPRQPNYILLFRNGEKKKTTRPERLARITSLPLE